MTFFVVLEEADRTISLVIQAEFISNVQSITKNLVTDDQSSSVSGGLVDLLRYVGSFPVVRIVVEKRGRESARFHAFSASIISSTGVP